MSHKTKLLFAAAVVTPFFVLGVVAAHEESETEDTTNQTTSETETKKERKTGNEGLTLQQRLDKYKTQAKTRLNTAEKLRMQGRCKASQGVVSNIKGRITGLETSREKVYTNLLARLGTLHEKLEDKGIDTATFEAQIKELETMIDTFHTDLAKYKEAVADLAAMDCAADPDAFKASLEAARTLRAQVAKDGQAIRAYLSDTIKPALKSLREQLASQTEPTSNEGEQ